MPNRSHRANQLLIGAVLVLVCWVIYFNSIGNLFTNWDDGMIYSNEEIRSLDWNNIVSLFRLKNGATYQPLRVLSYAVDYHFWKLNPVGYHLTNIVFYVLTCLMVFLAMRSVSAGLREEGLADSHLRVASFGTLIFAVHPVHVEAVTWLAARKEVLQGFFFFLGFYLYLAGRKEEGAKKTVYLVAVVAVVLLAVLSKPSAIVFPAVILVYEIAAERKSFFLFLRRHWLFLAFVVGISVVFTTILINVMIEAGGIKAYRGWDLFSNILVPIYAFWESVRLLTSTINYSAAYTFSVPMPLWAAKNLLIVGLTLLLFVFTAYSLHWTKVVFFGVFFLVVTLLPYLNIIPISTLLADRYVFIASFSYTFLLGVLFDRVYAYRHKRMSEGFFKLLSMSLLFFLLLGYSLMTVRQNAIWANSYSLWADAVEKHPNSNTANALMGVVYLELGMNEKAAEYLKKAVQLLPYDYQSRNNLGIVYGKLQQYDQGIKEFMTAMQLKPDDDAIKINFAVLYERQKEYRKAEEILSYLIEKNPGDANLYFRKGLLFKGEGRFNDAVSEFNKSIELAPHIINPYEEIGNIYLSHFKDIEKAKYYYSKGIDAVPMAKFRVEELRQVIQDLEGRQ